MFLELKTIWKQLPEQLQGQDRRSPNPAQPKIPAGTKNPIVSLGRQWEQRHRPIGVLFSRHEDTGIWNFLVLIGPGDNEMGISIADVDVENEYPNIHLRHRTLA